MVEEEAKSVENGNEIIDSRGIDNKIIDTEVSHQYPNVLKAIACTNLMLERHGLFDDDIKDLDNVKNK